MRPPDEMPISPASPVRRRALGLALTGFVLLTAASPRPARADDKAQADEKKSNAVRAEALFKEGRRLAAAGDYAAACPKLAESQALDPAAGTALNTALCYEKEGKLASAWEMFVAAETLAHNAAQAARATVAKQKATELESKLSRINVVVSPGAPLDGFEVRCDGEPVSKAEWGVPIPRDGGGHDIEATAPGRKPWKMHVQLEPSGQTLSVHVELPPEDAAAPAAPTAAHPAPAAPALFAATPPDETPRNGHTQRLAGLIVGGAGVVTLGVALVAALEAKSNYDDALSACNNSTVCPPGGHGLALRSSADTWATVSTATTIGGGVALAAGAILFFSAPRGEHASVAVTPASQGTGLSLHATF